MKKSRREFLKLLGVATVVTVVPRLPIVKDRDEYAEENTDWVDYWEIDGVRYSHDPICPECNRPADKCWCGGECIGQLCIFWGYKGDEGVGLER